jgi:hypothetical protein
MRTWQYFFLHVYTLGEASEMRGKSETAERDEQESRGSKGEQSLSEPRVYGREQARAKEAARKKRRDERAEKRREERRGRATALCRLAQPLFCII